MTRYLACVQVKKAPSIYTYIVRIKKFSILLTLLLLLSACSSTGKSSTASNASEVFYSGCGYGYSQKPSSITLTCADGGMYIDQISYSEWTSTNAEGAGTFYMNDCDPDCASGNMIEIPVTISIGKPRVDAQGKMIFSELVMTSKKTLYNGSNSDTFDIGIEQETGVEGSSSQEEYVPLDPEQAPLDLLSRLNSKGDLWQINEVASSSAGQASQRRLGLYSSPDYVIECNLSYSGTWLFVYSDEGAAYDAFNSGYFFRTSSYSAELMYDPRTNLIVLLHTSLGGNKTCLNSAGQQLDYYATD